MRSTNGWRILSSSTSLLQASLEGGGEATYFRQDMFLLLPDLDDPATLGALMDLVRKLWGLPQAYAVPRQGCVGDPAWAVCWSGSTHGGDLGLGESEVEAWVDALCAANP